MQIHMGPIKVMKYNNIFDVVISADDKGVIEYWCPTTLEFPENGYVKFCSRHYVSMSCSNLRMPIVTAAYT